MKQACMPIDRVAMYCGLCSAYVGKVLGNGQGGSVPAEFVEFPERVKIVDVVIATGYTLVLADNGEVYSWGKFPVR